MTTPWHDCNPCHRKRCGSWNTQSFQAEKAVQTGKGTIPPAKSGI